MPTVTANIEKKKSNCSSSQKGDVSLGALFFFTCTLPRAARRHASDSSSGVRGGSSGLGGATVKISSGCRGRKLVYRLRELLVELLGQ